MSEVRIGFAEAALKALMAAERAHQVHAECDDCMERVADPASCEHCVESWDEAYELRQAALALADSASPSTEEGE